jgi:hypothetical protein
MDEMMEREGEGQGGGGPSAGELLANLDNLLGVFGKMIASGPVPDQIKQAAMNLQQQFRAIVEAATKGAQGGQGGQQQGGQPQPMRDQAQGTPMGQYA